MLSRYRCLFNFFAADDHASPWTAAILLPCVVIPSAKKAKPIHELAKLGTKVKFSFETLSFSFNVMDVAVLFFKPSFEIAKVFFDGRLNIFLRFLEPAH